MRQNTRLTINYYYYYYYYEVWTTLLTNTKYLPGLLALDFSLKSVGSKYPLVVLYTDTLEPEGHEALKLRNIPTKRIEYLLPSAYKDYKNDVRFYDCWSMFLSFPNSL